MPRRRLILLLVVLLSVAVARTVARPLTRLTRSADRVARVAEAELVRVADDESESAQPVRLEPVDVGARDEIGDLARAFDRVQSTAARLVERQVAGRRNVAQMFGHVGRRTQNLVGRQIALIDRLEQQETDPGRLEHLYRLDHISSRLRRNASSLVVLSGAAGADEHIAPVPLADVVRLALGEIEDYTRVDVQVPAGVVGRAGGHRRPGAGAGRADGERHRLLPAAHPGAGDRARRPALGARLTVVDHGIGMTERAAGRGERPAHPPGTARPGADRGARPVRGGPAGPPARLAGRAGRHRRRRRDRALEIPSASLVLRRADRAGATVARRRGAGSGPAYHGRRSTPSTTRRPARRPSPCRPASTRTLLSRATRSLDAGPSWNAFGRRASRQRDRSRAPDARSRRARRPGRRRRGSAGARGQRRPRHRPRRPGRSDATGADPGRRPARWSRPSEPAYAAPSCTVGRRAPTAASGADDQRPVGAGAGAAVLDRRRDRRPAQPPPGRRRPRRCRAERRLDRCRTGSGPG